MWPALGAKREDAGKAFYGKPRLPNDRGYVRMPHGVCNLPMVFMTLQVLGS